MSNLNLKIHSIDKENNHIVISVYTDNSQKSIDNHRTLNVDLSNYKDCNTGIDVLKNLAMDFAISALEDDKKDQLSSSQIFDLDLLNSPGKIFTYDMKEILPEIKLSNLKFTAYKLDVFN